MSFVPPGYVSHKRIGELTVRRLFPNAKSSASDAEIMNMVENCQYFLRGLLFEGKLKAVFHDCSLGQGRETQIREIARAFWLTEESGICLVRGLYYYGTELVSPVWFHAKGVRAELELTSLKGQVRADLTPLARNGGRPRKADTALSAYNALYPTGHEVTGETWKLVVAKVAAQTGEAVSIATLKAALKSSLKTH